MLNQPRLDWAKEQAVRCMTQHGLQRWKFAFNRNKRQLGVCKSPGPGRPGVIELSVHFVLNNSDADVLDAILHEIAHALVGPQHGHDVFWRSKCLEIGARPERTAHGVKMPAGKWQAECPGCKRLLHRYRRPKPALEWHCRTCGGEKGRLVWHAVA